MKSHSGSGPSVPRPVYIAMLHHCAVANFSFIPIHYYLPDAAMIPSAMLGRVSAMTSISPKISAHASFSQADTQAPLNLLDVSDQAESFHRGSQAGPTLNGEQRWRPTYARRQTRLPTHFYRTCSGHACRTRVPAFRCQCRRTIRSFRAASRRLLA